MRERVGGKTNLETRSGTLRFAAKDAAVYGSEGLPVAVLRTVPAS